MTTIPVDGAARSSVAVQFIAFITLYFLLQALLRLFGVSSLGLDDAEMVVITQALAPGYGSQPPLYNWLQAASTGLFGFGLPAIVILHFVLLWAVYALMFLAARIVLGDDVKAAAVALGLFAIPQIGWEALHSHTHTLLSLTLAAATLLAMLRVLARGAWLDYVILGLSFALGVLAKYSYIPFAAALLVAGVALPAFRARVLSWRMAAAIVIALVLVAPHLQWVWTHLDETLSRTSKFKIDANAGFLVGLARSFAAMIAGVAGYVALAVAVYAAAAFLPLGKANAAGTGEPIRTGLPGGRRFVLATLLVALAIVLVAVLGTGATEVKERWLQPILFTLPLALMIAVEPRLTALRERMLIVISGGIGVVLLIAMAVTYLLPDLHGGPLRATAPFGPLAADIGKLGFAGGYVLAEDHYIGGNLKLHLPGVTVGEPEYGLWPLAEGGKTAPVLLAWSGKRDKPPKPLHDLYEALCGPDGYGDPVATRLSAPYEHASDIRYELSVAIVPECPGVPR